MEPIILHLKVFFWVKNKYWNGNELKKNFNIKKKTIWVWTLI